MLIIDNNNVIDLICIEGWHSGYCRFFMSSIGCLGPAASLRAGRVGVRPCSSETNMVTSANQGALAVPDHECSFDYGQNCRRIDFGLVPGVLEKYLTSALGVTPRGSVSLHPEFDMSAGAGAALKRFACFVIAELDCAEAILTNPGAAAGLQDAILSMLLHHHPHSHSQHFSSHARTTVPAVVRRVEEYLGRWPRKPYR